VTAAEQPTDMLRRRGDHPAVVMAARTDPAGVVATAQPIA